MASSNLLTNSPNFDVIITGGGIIGSSIAYFLSANESFKGSVLVIEKSPGHFESSTGLSVGGIRQQFSTPENIKISKFGARFIKNADQHLSVDGEKTYIPFHESGYLFLASDNEKEALLQNLKIQIEHQVDVSYLSAKELKIRFPWLTVDDLAGACLGLKNEGWTDPHSLLRAFKNKARSLGANFIKDEVISLSLNSDRITQIKLRSGEKYFCNCFVNAAGPRASEIAVMAGVELPVFPRKRFVYTFVCKEKILNCPMVIDPTGVYFRSEGNKYLCGVSPPEEQDPDTLDLDVDYTLFDELIWPTLAARVEYFEAIRRDHSWAGHYAYNVLDQNAILGFHPDVKNFVFANGFSGHGLQQAPAVGRAINELITSGSYQTLDLSRFGYDRIKTGKLVKEKNVV